MEINNLITNRKDAINELLLESRIPTSNLITERMAKPQNIITIQTVDPNTWKDSNIDFQSIPHDQISHGINEDILIKIFIKIFGAPKVFGPSWVCDTPIQDWTLASIREFSNIPDKTTLTEIKAKFHSMREALDIRNPVRIDITREHPLISRQGSQYEGSIPIGYIDMIVHYALNTSGSFSPYEDRHIRELVIEIKKESDFKNTGAILAQIKRYMMQYRGICPGLVSKFLPSNFRYSNDLETKFCVVAPNIPKLSQDMLEAEGIVCIELNKLMYGI